MKSFVLLTFLATASTPAFCAEKVFNTICGIDKGNGNGVVTLDIQLKQASQFSNPEIVTIDGQAPGGVEGTKAWLFGPKNYESVTLDIKGCDGSAVYKHYDESSPMNPMETLNMRCDCPGPGRE